MKKYKVIEFNSNPLIIKNVPDFYLKDVMEMKEIYGLYAFDDYEIYLKWHNYSEDKYCAGWLIPSKETVEECFEVVLEEIK